MSAANTSTVNNSTIDEEEIAEVADREAMPAGISEDDMPDYLSRLPADGQPTDALKPEDDNRSEDEMKSEKQSSPSPEQAHQLRIIEALLFAAGGPLSVDEISAGLSSDADVVTLLSELQDIYKSRGVNVVQVNGKWTLRTAEDLSFLLRREAVEQKKLSKAALETLAIIAYHQPVTRADIEDVRGVAISKGTLDMLLEIGWVRLRGRRRTPGRPVTYGTTDTFMEHFGLNDLKDLPGAHELKGAGLLSSNLPPDFDIPIPQDSESLLEDEEPLEDEIEPALEMDLPDFDETDR